MYQLKSVRTIFKYTIQYLLKLKAIEVLTTMLHEIPIPIYFFDKKHILFKKIKSLLKKQNIISRLQVKSKEYFVTLGFYIPNICSNWHFTRSDKFKHYLFSKIVLNFHCFRIILGLTVSTIKTFFSQYFKVHIF